MNPEFAAPAAFAESKAVEPAASATAAVGHGVAAQPAYAAYAVDAAPGLTPGPAGYMPMAVDVRREGWMHKLGGVVKNWKHRWFTLANGSLQYCGSPGGDVRGTINLADCHGVCKVSGTKSGLPEGVISDVIHLMVKERVYVLACSSLMDMTGWLDVLTRAASMHRSAPTSEIEIVAAGVTHQADKSVSFGFEIWSNQGTRQKVHEFDGRFSHLLKIHETLGGPPPSGVSLQSHYQPRLEFPPKSFFLTDMTSPDNVAVRNNLLKEYYCRLFTEPTEGGAVFCSPTFHQLFNMPPHVASFCVGIGRARAAAAAQQQAQQQAAEAAAVAQEVADSQAAQGIQQYPCPPGSVPVLVYPRQLNFKLRNKFFSFGDAKICAVGVAGEIPWFKVLRVDGLILSSLLQNCQFSLATLAGQPLMFLQEEFQFFTYRYSIYRTTPTGHQLLICTIVRKVMASMMTATDQYSIELHDHAAHPFAISCSGSWPNSFTLIQRGHAGSVVAATVTKKIFSMVDTYNVCVAPNVDVLLFLGIATAIDRIHHEVEDRRR